MQAQKTLAYLQDMHARFVSVVAPAGTGCSPPKSGASVMDQGGGVVDIVTWEGGCRWMKVVRFLSKQLCLPPQVTHMYGSCPDNEADSWHGDVEAKPFSHNSDSHARRSHFLSDESLDTEGRIGSRCEWRLT